ncbi:PREDICTED: uncharacterized protein LOC104824314 isoform X2 [Tarenaya hassleriana]|nr:PREDICTED: uncharacterized protein LOC104824314 isoform X2 [Tarenaya hassleriana]
MHSIKVTWSGRTFAIAKSNESGGKKSRNRIPREERKALVESFIKKHQRLNSGNFPSLSLTHKEVGGSFYTIREIFREIIQENRVLGPADLIFEEKGTDQEQEQSQSISILTGPLAPLSLSPNGSLLDLDHRQHMLDKFVVVPSTCSSEAEVAKTLGDGENINGSQEGKKDRESHVLVCGKSETSQSLEENAGLLVQFSPSSASEISEFLPASRRENNVSEHDMAMHESAESLNGSFPVKHGERKIENGNNVHGMHFDMDDKKNVEVICSESKAAEPVEVDKTVKDDTEAMTETMNLTGSMSDTITTMIDMSEGIVVETFPFQDSCNQQTGELENSKETGKTGIGTEGKTLEADSSGVNTAGREVSLATSLITGEKKTGVIVDQPGNKTFDPLVGENIINPASIHIECVNDEDSVVMDALCNNVDETGESSNGTLSAWTSEQKLPTYSNESGKAENNGTETDGKSNVEEAAVAEGETTMEDGEIEAMAGSSSREGSIPTLNRIKPESWKDGSVETNPFVAILKSFITAFVKFWSE